MLKRIAKKISGPSSHNPGPEITHEDPALPRTTGVVAKLSDYIYALSELGITGPRAFMHINGINDSKTFTTKDGGLVGVIELQGQYQVMAQDRFEEMLDALENRWRSVLNKRGVSFEFTFIGGEKALIRKQLNDAIAPNIATSKRHNLGLENIIKSDVETLIKHCSYEKAYMAVWVQPSVLQQVNGKNATKEMNQYRSKRPLAGSKALNIHGVASAIQSEHRAIVEQALNDLGKAKIVARSLDTDTVLRELRMMVEPENTDYRWMPSTVKNAVIRPGISVNKHDYSHLLPPGLDQQIYPNPIGNLVDTQKVINIGNKLHSGVIVTRPCLTPTNFSEFINLLSAANMPYRIKLLLEGDGLAVRGMKSKNMLAKLFAFSSGDNRAFREAIKQLNEMRESSETDVGISITAETWVRLKSENELHIAEGMELLNAQVERLTKAVQAWGTMDTKHVSGDPLFTHLSTMPCMTLDTPGERAAAPIRDALVLLPLFRPASYWDSGGMLLRTGDGKLIPYQPVSDKQKAWGEIVIAPMRFGKSLWQQARNFALWTSAGIDELPYIMTLDIGYSSSGLVNLIRSSLAEDDKDMAIYRKMKMDEDHAINPFDTPLGVRYPTASKMQVLNNTMQLLVSNDKNEVYDGVASLINKLIMLTYKQLADGQNPRGYDAGQNRKIAEYVEPIKERIIGPAKRLTWWRVVDYLIDQQMYDLAEIAQRYAVPRLTDIASNAADREIRVQYAQIKVATGETAPEYVSRTIADIVDQYPILRSETKFSVGNARVIALNLEDVTSKDTAPSAVKQTCLMYLLCREALIGRLKIDEDDVARFPEKVQAYHLDRVRKLQSTSKSLNYDEVHRFKGQQQIIDVLELDVREGPKYRIVTSLATQEIGDLSETLVNLASNKILLGVGNPKDAKKVQQMCGLSDAATQRLSQIKRPDQNGSRAIYMLDIEEEQGPIMLDLFLTLSPEKIWAFTTTNEDNSLRLALYRLVGAENGIALLAKYFPETSCTAYLEKLRMANRGDEKISYIDEVAELMAADTFDRDKYLVSVQNNIAKRG